LRFGIRLTVVMLAFGFAISHAQSAIITQWNFETQPVTGAPPYNNSPIPSTGAGVATPLGMNIYPTPAVGVTSSDILLGVAGDTGLNGAADISQIWRVRAQGTVAAPANGWSSLAPIGAQGAVFKASTAGFNAINVSFDWYGTNQGEAKLQLEYTTNGGGTWNNVPIIVPATDTQINPMVNAVPGNTVVGAYVFGSPAGQGQNWFPGLSAILADPAAANNPNFGIEMVNASTDGDNVSLKGTPLNNNSGNWRFDNVTISGNAVPEPSTLVLCGIAILGLLASRMKRK
jgi:PEP-CTERM motif